MALPFFSLFARRSVRIPPPAVLALLYAGLIVIGAALLMLPFAAIVPVHWSDAVFTAASAVTVTGLFVLDTGRDFTAFGQAVILVLIQLGGLGIMTFTFLVLSMFGIPFGLPQRIFLREDLNQTSISDVLRLVKVILRVVLACELVGTALLALLFVPEFGWGEGLWLALFHAVSAFNNAGFSLFPGNMTGWATSPLMNAVIPALIIIGGLGYLVLADIARVRGWRALSLHSKLMLSGTAALLVFSVVMFAFLEWDNPGTLGGLDGIGDKLMVSWFQAVTTRTAGFNSVDMRNLYDSTSLMFICLMLIGGGSTSTAGGVKVTTFVVLLLATVAFFRQRRDIHAFGRSLGYDEVLKVLALTVVSTLIVIVAIFIISVSHEGDFLDLAFEVASAFGTVGLSRGATAQLDSVGWVVIIVVMFIGRIGPLTLGFFLARRTPPRVRYPWGRVFLG